MPINSVIHTNRHSIDRVMNAGIPVALVFWDKRRSPIKANEKELDRLAAKYAGRALIARVNAAEEDELLSRFRIDDVPSFAFVDRGNVIERTPIDEPDYVDAWLSHLTDGKPRPQRPHAGSNDASASAESASNAASRSVGGKPVTLTDANFGAIISGLTPVLVDFWAEWCGPCRMVAPSVEQLAQEFDGRAIVGKLNVEENPVTAGQYDIRSIPSLLIFKNGQVVDQIVGAQPLPVLRQHLAALV